MDTAERYQVSGYVYEDLQRQHFETTVDTNFRRLVLLQKERLYRIYMCFEARISFVDSRSYATQKRGCFTRGSAVPTEHPRYQQDKNKQA